MDSSTLNNASCNLSSNNSNGGEANRGSQEEVVFDMEDSKTGMDEQGEEHLKKNKPFHDL